MDESIPEDVLLLLLFSLLGLDPCDTSVPGGDGIKDTAEMVWS